MSITFDLNIDFDEKKWEDLINSDEIFTEQFSKSINTIENTNIILHQKDIVKLSINDLQKTTFINTNKFMRIDRLMTILIPPCSNQRVRYENECKKIFRFISVPNNKTMTIKIPDLRDILLINDVLWMRITRTTINHRKDNLIFYHPYPIWIKNKKAKIHNGSIYIQITNKDMENGFIEIDTLTMIRLKQDELAKINALGIYSSSQLDYFDIHLIKIKTPKRIRDEYKLRQSILNFQLVRVDENNIAYPTDCLCQTESICECEANDQQKIDKKYLIKIMDQPYDVSISKYDDNDDKEFNNIDGKLTVFSYSQADNNVFYSPVHNGSRSSPIESLTLNNFNEISNRNFDSIETLSAENSPEFDEQLFPEVQLAESPMDFIETTTENIPERINLKSVDSSIQKQLVSVSIQPTNNDRRRYKCEGKRRIKKLLRNPMTLSKLQNYELDSNQSLWLRLNLITVGDNVIIHPDKLKYYSKKVKVQKKDGSIYIPVTQSDIEKGKIELTDLSIIKTKDNTYTFKLIPYNTSTINNESATYTINPKKTIAGNAKVFRKIYNVEASQIACQILINENESYVFTDITCKTEVMVEKKYQPKATKPKKRLVKKNQKSGKKRRNTIKSKSKK